jgi:transposase
VRVSSAFSRLLCLPEVWVRSVSFAPSRVAVTVALRARLLRCPQCPYSTPNRESLQHHDSVWRHLDLRVWRLEVHARLRRLVCPAHGALVEGVPFARDGARFTHDFENLVAWLATTTDKTATCRLTRIDWKTIGRVIERVAGEHLGEQDRLSELFEISIAHTPTRTSVRVTSPTIMHGEPKIGKSRWLREIRAAANAPALSAGLLSHSGFPAPGRMR